MLSQYQRYVFKYVTLDITPFYLHENVSDTVGFLESNITLCKVTNLVWQTVHKLQTTRLIYLDNRFPINVLTNAYQDGTQTIPHEIARLSAIHLF
jgi:hypothetical protein